VNLARPALVAVACLLAAGCTSTVTGHGTVDAARLPAGSAPPTAGGSTARHLPLSRIPLRQSDLPVGWQAHPSTRNDDSNGLDSRLRACAGQLPTEHGLASADSPDFSQGEATISSTATRYRTQAVVDSDVRLLRSKRTNVCLNRYFGQFVAQSAPAGVTVSDASFHIDAHPGGPANLVGLGSGSLTITGPGGSIRTWIDVAFIAGPRIEAGVTFIGFGLPIDHALRDRLIAVVASRAAKA
jgi:hypothetical protein